MKLTDVVSSCGPELVRVMKMGIIFRISKAQIQTEFKIEGELESWKKV